MNDVDAEVASVPPDPPGRVVIVHGPRWSLMFTLLSMDVVQPFLASMGLTLAEGLRSTLRDVVLLHARPDPTTPSMFVPDVITEVAETFGDTHAEALVEWGRFVFAYDSDEHLDLLSWRSVLEEFEHDPSLWDTLGLPAYLRAAAHERVLATVERGDTALLHEQVWNSPLSDWDACLFVLRGFRLDEDDPQCNHPARWIRDTTEIRRDREFWSWLLARIDEPTQAALHQAALRHIGDEELRHPRVLLR